MFQLAQREVLMIQQRLGFVGLGLMGLAMATRLVKAGHTLVIHNRTKSKGDSLLTAGARWGNNPAEVARESEIVFTMLSTPDVLKETALGAHGILTGLKKDGIHVDCSTPPSQGIWSSSTGPAAACFSTVRSLEVSRRHQTVLCCSSSEVRLTPSSAWNRY